MMRVFMSEGDVREAVKVAVNGNLTLVRLADGHEEWMVPAEIVEDDAPAKRRKVV
jgi:hypothetical protein